MEKIAEDHGSIGIVEEYLDYFNIAMKRYGGEPLKIHKTTLKGLGKDGVN